ncbi:MAG: DUF4125 family protein [Bacillota bacterium]|nr:DUF4125 family protein [Bacillota bacterium]
MNNTIRQILDIEWEMFHNVNGEERTDCQNQQETFEKMRTAQFEAWNDDICASYLEDLKNAVADGRSLVREKYIHMMKNTDPEGYNAFKCELHDITDEKIELTDKIWQHLLSQTERIREKYPVLALGGRPLTAAEEKDWASVETYQKGELLTYSVETIKKLLAHIEELEAKGEDIAYTIQKNSILCLGYKTMEEAELAMAAQFMNELGVTVENGCPTCKTDNLDY